jgi:transposase
VLSVEDWAEMRRLHRAEGMPIKQVARVMGVSKNTVKRALAAERPPRYQRPSRGSVVDAVEPRIRELLQAWPTMPATVIAERIGWTRSLTVLKDRVRKLRPAYLPPDPASRTAYAAGEVAQCDLWFPAITLPVGFGQTRPAARLPVLVMVTGYARWLTARLIPRGPPRTCSPAGGSSSKGLAGCRGCWYGTARARSANAAGARWSSPSRRRRFVGC